MTARECVCRCTELARIVMAVVFAVVLVDRAASEKFATSHRSDSLAASPVYDFDFCSPRRHAYVGC